MTKKKDDLFDILAEAGMNQYEDMECSGCSCEQVWRAVAKAIIDKYKEVQHK